jgi:hypothetical protein
LLAQTHRPCELANLLQPLELFVVQNDQAPHLAGGADEVTVIAPGS